MKRFIPILLLLCLLFTACKADVAPNISIKVNSEAVSGTEELSEEILIPQFIADLIDMNLATKAAVLGIDNVTQNKDGSLSYRTNATQKAQIVIELQAALAEHLLSLSSSTDWPFAKEVKINDAYTEVRILSSGPYNKEQDRPIAASLYAPVVLYRVFAGLETNEDFTLAFVVTDSETLEVVDAFTYPDADVAEEATE